MTKANWIGWVYSCLSLPLFFLTYVHQGVALFFMLLAIYLYLRQKLWSSAVALSFGFASKITPIILLAPIMRFLWPNRRSIIHFCLVVVIVISLVFLPFIALGGGKWIMASFQALSEVGSYGTVWAMLDANWGPGTYGPLENRIHLERAGLTQTNPSLIPALILTLVFLALYGWLFIQPIDRGNPRHFILFTTLTMLVFQLWSRGWSPHWAMMLIPLFLLSFPDWRGLLWVLLLTGIVFVEWPFLAISGSRPLIATFILIRTGLFLGIGVYLFLALKAKREIYANV